MENEIHEIPAKPKRNYKPRAPKPAPEHLMTPLPPNPNVMAAEARINELIEQRLAAQFQASRANQQLQSAQLAFQSAKDEVSRLEAEISFRQSIINQMRGGQPSQAGSGYANAPVMPVPPAQHWIPPGPQSPSYAPAAPYPQYPAPYDPRFTGPVDSVPANNRGLYPDLSPGPDGARTGSAEEMRNEEIRTRGY